MNPARTVAEWLTWAAAVPRLTYTPTDLGDEPPPTSATPSDPDGLRAEDAQARSFEWFVA